MGDTPAWTRDVHSYASTRWVWRKEITTVTWWPLSAGAQEPPPIQTTDAKAQHATAKNADWNCLRGQSSWSWRRACYACYVPRGMDPTHPAATSTAGTAPINNNDERTTDLKPSAPSSSSANPADANMPGQI